VNDGGARAGARAVLPYTRISVVVVAVVRTGTAARFGYLGFIDDGVGVVVIIDAFGNFPEKNRVRMGKQSENTKKPTPKKHSPDSADGSTDPIGARHGNGRHPRRQAGVVDIVIAVTPPVIQIFGSVASSLFARRRILLN
jgi:hypothetical protein